MTMKAACAFLLALAVVAGTTSCLTVPVSAGSSSAVPSDRIYRAEYVGAATVAEQATVVFRRDAGFSGP